MNRADNLFRRAEEHPARVALIFGDRTIGFGEWRDRAKALADGFRRQGMQPGDRVAFFVGRGRSSCSCNMPASSPAGS